MELQYCPATVKDLQQMVELLGVLFTDEAEFHPDADKQKRAIEAILANPTKQQFKDGTIFVCQVGERSAVASEMAVALGVKDVVNFRGGTKAWKDAGLPLETP